MCLEYMFPLAPIHLLYLKINKVFFSPILVLNPYKFET